MFSNKIPHWLRLAKPTDQRQALQPRPAADRRGPRRNFGCLLLEQLEERIALAANLQAVSISVTPGAVVGEQSNVSARFESTDLVAGTQFSVQLSIDGQVLLSQNRTAGEGVDQTYSAAFDWFARPGLIEVRVDTDDAIAEADETDNVAVLDYTPADPLLPEKLVYPIFRRSPGDGFVLNYVDVEPRDGPLSDIFVGGPFTTDFRGGRFAYDRHTGVDYYLQGLLPGMDAGIPVFAAASGTVTNVYEGIFDRQTNSPNVTELPNQIDVDLGQGWEVYYAHFATNTMTVRAGDRIQAGQMLGLAGSSGNTRIPHLHFNITHLGRTVESHLATEKYWRNPVSYSGDAPSSIFASGITNYTFSTDLGTAPTPTEIKEAPSDTRVFPTASTTDVVYWARVTPVRVGDPVQVQWRRPDGSLAAQNDQTVPARQLFNTLSATWTLEHAVWSQYPGTWHVAMVVNGREIDRQSFEVTTGPGVPEIRVTQGNTYIINGRTTPIPIGRGKVFTIQNHGSTELTTSDLQLPPGFALVGEFPARVAPGTSADFTVQPDTDTAGPLFGALRFHTNDADESNFDFNIDGRGRSLSAGMPRIALTQPAVTFINSGEPQPIAATARITDADSTQFNTGRLTVEFASGGSANDRLAIRSQGTEAGQIGVSSDVVSYGGEPIGSVSGGDATPLVVTLNENATLAAVEALVRSVTFSNVSSRPATNHRYVRLTLIDETGKPSNMQIAHVVVDPRPAIVLGDFDADRVLTANDIDLLAAAVRAADNKPQFDLTGDGQVNQSDHTYWVAQARKTRPGDANLNGQVQLADFAALAAHFGSSGGWADGDFDGDGQIAFSDFLLLAANFGFEQ